MTKQRTVHRKLRRGTAAARALVIAGAFIAVFPVVYTAVNAFNNGFGTGFLPEQWGFYGFYEAFIRRPDYLIKFWNSLLISAVIAAGQVIISCLAGYGFSKFTFPFKEAIYFFVIIMMLMPYQVTLVSNSLMVDLLHIDNTYWALILPGIFSPFGVFLMRQAFDSMSEETREAAMLEGGSQLTILRKIALPGCKSTVAALALLSFVDAWNMVEQPLVFLKDSLKYPLSVFLAQMDESNIGVLCVCGILAAFPVLALFFFCEEDLMDSVANLKV